MTLLERRSPSGQPPAAAATAAAGRRRRRRPGMLAAAVFLAPTLLLLVVLRVVPLGQAIDESVHSGLPGSTLPPRLVGLDNFQALFSSPHFWASVRQTLVFNTLVNPIQVVIALALAVLLTRGLPGSGLWRTLVFLPAAVPMTGSTIVWGVALRPDGPVNGVLGRFGITQQPFLTSPDQVIASLMLIASWIGVGYWMIFLIAGLKDVPEEYYEAARLDGAGPLRTFVSVTLPQLRRPLLFVLVADTVANFVLFAPVQILTDGGPEGRSNLLMFDIFHNSYELSDPYTASAELIVLLALMTAIVTVQFRLLRTADGD